MSNSTTNIASWENGLLQQDRFIVGPDDRILVTGAAGFIGSRVLLNLLDRGLRNLVCFVRPSSELSEIEAIIEHRPPNARIEVHKGNLLSREDCEAAAKGAAVIYHLAAGTGEKSFPDAFLNSVVATRNLVEATLRFGSLRRFLLVSSFAVYSNCEKPNANILDETCPVEEHPELRGDAYCFAKVRQEQLVTEYGKNAGMPYVLVRPGSVYGGINSDITGRVGISAFGPFLHLGGSNTIPFTYVDNCAEAIVLAGLVKGVDGEAFNVVDDDLPSSRKFLRLYKKSAKNNFKSIYVPHAMSYALCYLWEKYSKWSERQLPPAFTRKRWHSEWKKTRYSNQKLKTKLGWMPKVSTAEGLRRYIEACTRDRRYA
jgi:nucleoside-diphosphate-sugar epimerase